MLSDKVHFPCSDRLREAWRADTGVEIEEAVRLLTQNFDAFYADVDISMSSSGIYKLTVTFNEIAADDEAFANDNVEDALKAEFTIEIDDAAAYHNHIRIQDNQKCSGAGTLFTFNRFAMYDLIGVRGVELESAYSHGFMAWAKMGFVPDFDEAEGKAVVHEMVKRTWQYPDMFSEEERLLVQDLAQTPNGDNFRRLFGINRDALHVLLEGHEKTPMLFDLHSEQREFFNERVANRFPELLAEAA